MISVDREEHKRLCYCMLYYYVEMYKLPFPWRQLLLSGHQWTSEPGFGPCKTCKSAPMEEQIAHISLFVSEISIFVLLCIYKKKNKCSETFRQTDGSSHYSNSWLMRKGKFLVSSWGITDQSKHHQKGYTRDGTRKSLMSQKIPVAGMEQNQEKAVFSFLKRKALWR